MIGTDRVILRSEAHLWLLLLFAGLCVLAAGAPWLVEPGAAYGDDNSAHFALAVHLSRVLEAGHADLWWHPSNSGVPLFAAYQPLPGMVMGTVLALLGDVLRPDLLFKSSILLPWALMPLAWGRGARWLDLDLDTCLILGLLTLTVHDPDSIGFSIRSSTVRGLYTQHFGLLMLPLAVGSVWRRAVGRDDSALFSACMFSLLALSHLWVGLYGTIVLGAFVVAEPTRAPARLRRMVPVICLSGIILAPWLLPLLQTNAHAGGLPWKRELHNGWPVSGIVSRLLGGDLFDHGRLGVLTGLAILGGAGLTLRAHRGPARRWLVLSLVTSVLFLGRTNLGQLYSLLPLHEQVNVMRYLTGVHVCGLVAAALVLARGSQSLHPRWRFLRPFVLCSIFCAALATGLTLMRPTLRTFDPERETFAELVDHLRAGPDTRFAVHGRLGTASHFHRDLLPLLSGRGQLQSYAHGYHCTLSTYYSEYFDYSPAAAGLFGVGAVVAKRPIPDGFPADAWPAVWRNESYAVLRRPAGDADLGWFSFSTVEGRIEGPDLQALRPAVRALAIPAWARGVSPELVPDSELQSVFVVGPDGGRRPWRSDEQWSILDHLAPGVREREASVLDQQRGLSHYEARVQVPDGEPAWLVLKVNAFPWWEATIDGDATEFVHVATNFMAVAVPAGEHIVRYVYRNPPAQKLGALVSLMLLLIGLVSGLRRLR